MLLLELYLLFDAHQPNNNVVGNEAHVDSPPYSSNIKRVYDNKEVDSCDIL